MSKQMLMRMIVAVAMVVSSVIMACCQSIKNKRIPSMADIRKKVNPWISISLALTLTCDLAAGGNSGLRIMADILPALAAIFLMNLSLWKEERDALRVAIPVLSLNLCLSIYYVLCAAGVVRMVSAECFLYFVMVMVCVLPAVFVVLVWRHLRAVKSVMKGGTVWTNVMLCTDGVYIAFLFMAILLYTSLSMLAGHADGLHAIIVSILLFGMYAALSVRVLMDSVFIFWHGQERTIVESMKITNVDSVADTSRIDDVYKDIYERVVVYFENEKPFLDSDLTINALVKALYSNKLYISRAISQFTGRNFCQFVNYYRVMYSIQCFRMNPELKMHELATMSGFNSIVSYNMAFRLFMGENPSDWSRKEKNRLIRGKK